MWSLLAHQSLYSAHHKRSKVASRTMSSRKRDYKYCQHCEKELNVKRFKEHERLYYNKDTNEWLKEIVEASDQESEFSCFDGLEGLDVLEDNEENCEMEDWNLTDTDGGDQNNDVEENDVQNTHLLKHNEGMQVYSYFLLSTKALKCMVTPVYQNLTDQFITHYLCIVHGL